MSNRERVLLAFLTIVVDLIMAALAFYTAYRIRLLVPFPVPLRLGPFGNYIEELALQLLSFLATFALFGLYRLRWEGSRIDLFYTVLAATSIAVLASTALTYLIFFQDRDLARGMILYGWAFSIPLVLIGRGFTGLVRRYVRRRHPERLLFVGTGDAARILLQKVTQSPRLRYHVVGFVDDQRTGERVAGLPVLGSQGDLASIVREHDIQEVVIALTDASHEELLDMIADCESERATVRIFPDVFQIVASEVRISDMDGLPLLTVRDVALRGWKLAAKRALDLVVSVGALVFLSPLLLFIALLVKLDSKGPAFYAQERVGLDGKPFYMLKFRSMREGAEEETGPVWAQADDPRSTRVGAFLRRTSLDELPQLINVLRGEMSLVGPRPERPIFVEQFRQVLPRYMERHNEKAGITGWAQVNGLRGDTSIVERTKYDLYYIENWSLLFDLKIIVRTIMNQLRGDRNAY
ncbi:MAG: undecaprenyl-phosphate glucose phosphotransferase [Chloroflexota bacterium]|nr:undecaprenyl-phosphate glucose phosphotransferase [Chloroflexota bacterium]